MKFRIGMINDKFFAQGRFGLCWKSLPSTDHYNRFEMLRWKPQFTEFFSSFDEAAKLIEEYRRLLCRSDAVFVEVK